MDYKTAEEGWVYCIANPRDPEQVKIGMTSKTTMEQRLKEASRTFVSEGFYIVIAMFVKKPYEREQRLHRILRDARVNPLREFFDVAACGGVERILDLFLLMEGTVHPASRKSLRFRSSRVVAPANVPQQPPPEHAPLDFSQFVYVPESYPH